MKGKLMMGLALAASVWSVTVGATPARQAPRKAAAKPATPFAFRNVRVSLPQDFDVEYPAGAGADAVNANCRACHSPSMVLSQPPLSAEEWHKEVRKMIDVYKAPIAEDQVGAITGYLTALSASAAK
ncbi:MULTISPECIES: cytochrome c [unclassified Novosphingobium]|uniref:cytochrome c n=1 Tax=unclassified Novosphingobium TaxID=2644732 RepID=UPI00086DA8BD|nr:MULTISPECIES: cytochrome c [unclassified Novosphingobium]MBN9144599.1 cytochrome c [Novosphingobium sp.]MDR6707931.1 cytochrome c5 [Novosphingobium sp. 1748]ODU78787.1 MAG: hypothetical protein ABT10_21990 [Novosphingobium sp. SCN 63-17]OJX93689.1 MAG: hypothetical protein BGP00_11885 [Novosphingobium sp. 63-713]